MTDNLQERKENSQGQQEIIKIMFLKIIFLKSFNSWNSRIKKHNLTIFKYLGKQNLIMTQAPNSCLVRLRLTLRN